MENYSWHWILYTIHIELLQRVYYRHHHSFICSCSKHEHLVTEESRWTRSNLNADSCSCPKRVTLIIMLRMFTVTRCLNPSYAKFTDARVLLTWPVCFSVEKSQHHSDNQFQLVEITENWPGIWSPDDIDLITPRMFINALVLMYLVGYWHVDRPPFLLWLYKSAELYSKIFEAELA